MSPETIVEEKLVPAQIVRRLDILPNEYPPYEIVKNGLRGKRWENILTENIQMDIVINDERHVQDLSRSIFGEKKTDGLGQISPINVAAFLDENENIYYLVTDGFHRTDAFIRVVEPHIDSIVLYGLTLEEVYDLRVLAANSVKSTGFARVIEFMQKSFEQTAWYKEKGLTLLQTFSLCVQDTSGVKLQLNQDESKALKSWGSEKARFWGRTPGSIFQMLLIASKADPELVRKVRIGARGRGDGGGDFNTASLKAMTDVIPDRHDLQRIVYEAVVQNDLVEDETRRLAKAVAYFDNNDQPDIVELACSKAKVVVEISKNISDQDVMKDILLVGEYHNLTEEETIKLSEKIKEAGEDDEIKDQIYEEPQKFINSENILTDTVSSKPNSVDEPHNRKNKRALDSQIFDGIYSDKSRGYSVNHTTTELEAKIKLLEEELIKALENTGGISWKRRKRTWWKSLPNLSIEEIKIYEQIFSKKQRIKDVAKELNLTQNQVVRLIYSGVNKYSRLQREQLLDCVSKHILFDQKNKKQVDD